MSNEVLGFEAKAYRNTGTHAAPTWAEMKRCRDVSVSLTKTKVDTSRRESKWKLQRGGMIEASVSINYMYEKSAGSDTDFDALQASFTAGTEIQFAFVDQAIATSNAQGLRAFCEVTDMSYEQPLDDAQVVNFELTPTPTEEAGALVEPSWYEVP